MIQTCMFVGRINDRSELLSVGVFDDIGVHVFVRKKQMDSVNT